MFQGLLLSGLIAQLFLAVLTAAAPAAMSIETVTVSGGNAWQYGTGGGILGLIILILDVFVFSTSRSPNGPPPLGVDANHPLLRCCS